jgi:hypothetical protein
MKKLPKICFKMPLENWNIQGLFNVVKKLKIALLNIFLQKLHILIDEIYFF